MTLCGCQLHSNSGFWAAITCLGKGKRRYLFEKDRVWLLVTCWHSRSKIGHKKRISSYLAVKIMWR